MTDITPGSLAERVLHHITVAKGEFTAEELAETLEADVGECRTALGTLRRAFKLTTKMEDGVATYRLAGEPAGTRIAGSSLQPAATPTERPKRTPAANPVQPKKRGPAPKLPGVKTALLAWMKQHPGGQKRADIEEGLGGSASTIKTALQQLAAEGLMVRTGSTLNAIWHLPGEEIDLQAHAEKRKEAASAFGKKGAAKSAALRPVQTPAPKEPKARKPRRNLAEFGATMVRDLEAAPMALRGFDHAISDDGVLAITPRGTGQAVRLAPADITQLIGFLEKTQHVWKQAA